MIRDEGTVSRARRNPGGQLALRQDIRLIGDRYDGIHPGTASNPHGIVAKRSDRPLGNGDADAPEAVRVAGACRDTGGPVSIRFNVSGMDNRRITIDAGSHDTDRTVSLRTNYKRTRIGIEFDVAILAVNPNTCARRRCNVLGEIMNRQAVHPRFSDAVRLVPRTYPDPAIQCAGVRSRQGLLR